MVVRSTITAAIESRLVTKTKTYIPPKTPIDGIKYDLTITTTTTPPSTSAATTATRSRDGEGLRRTPS